MIFSLCACAGKGKFADETKTDNQSDQQIEGQEQGEGEGASTVEDMIEKYHKSSSRNVKAYLILGIDRSGEATDVDTGVGGGQSDGIYVIAMDEDNKKTTVLQINRDTYTDVIVPDIFGNEMTTKKERLGLAYAAGSGGEDSCINAEKSISRFLHGLEFDGYVSIYYDAIAPVVDSMGGVDIVIEDDMTGIAPEFIKGEKLHLNGNQSYKFCRARTGVGDETNLGRMRRQRSFLDSFMAACRAEIKSKSSIINDMYNASSPYIVSNMGSGEIINIAAKALSYSDGGIVTPAGTDKWVTGDDGIRYSQFTVDETSLDEILKGLFALEK